MKARSIPVRACLKCALPVLVLAAMALAQDPPTPPAAANAPAAVSKDTAEMSMRDTPATFKTRVNLVLVPVIIRDRQGHAIGDLKQDDFQLFDRGKLQIITKFSVEKPGSPVVREKKTLEGVPIEVSEEPAVAAAMPDRFIAYLFDDVHLKFGDLAFARDAVDRSLASLKPNERAAIFTTSGQTTLQFTGDRGKLHETLLALRPRPIAASSAMDCPSMDYYIADLIENKNDPTALQAMTAEAMNCLPYATPQSADSAVRSAASREMAMGDQETRLALLTLKDAIRAVSAMPGQRTVILTSPGFLTPTIYQQDKNEIIDRAIKANVIISSLDVRGLYTVVPGGDISTRDSRIVATAGMRTMFENASASQQADVLAEIAEGTGGVFFHNNNDLNEGLRRVAAAPEYVYILGFSPQNLKLDGGFHGLKVTLRNRKGLTLQGRRGYYAPKHLMDPAETAKQEIEEALFSREEMNDIPIEVHTQFFKPEEFKAKLSVIARVDLAHLRYRKEDGRNRNELTVVAALFDRNGNYVIGNSKLVEMRLLDRTLENKQRSTLTLRSSFDVATGGYMVRVVVRDAEGQMMAAQNGAVEIP
jgi:VWFA-related protein